MRYQLPQLTLFFRGHIKSHHGKRASHLFSVVAFLRRTDRESQIHRASSVGTKEFDPLPPPAGHGGEPFEGPGACEQVRGGRVPVPARVRVLVLVPGLDGDDISPDLLGVLVIRVQRAGYTLRLPI